MENGHGLLREGVLVICKKAMSVVGRSSNPGLGSPPGHSLHRQVRLTEVQRLSPMVAVGSGDSCDRDHTDSRLTRLGPRPRPRLPSPHSPPAHVSPRPSSAAEPPSICPLMLCGLPPTSFDACNASQTLLFFHPSGRTLAKSRSIHDCPSVSCPGQERIHKSECRPGHIGQVTELCPFGGSK